MPSTTISPKVSKPRKSTSITLTTLVPPPSLSARSRKKVEVLSGKGRLIMASASTVMPPPAAMARAMSRQRRSRVRRSCAWEEGRRFSSRLGNQRSPSRMRMVVTTSTTICVSARSGAENHRNVMHTQSPAAPASVRAARRWYLACHAAAKAQVPPITQSTAKTGDSGRPARSPMCRPRNQSGQLLATTAAATSHSICHCSRLVDSARRPLRPPRLRRARAPANRRSPSIRCISGGASSVPLARCQRNKAYSTIPPASATRLITSGMFTPCQMARLYSGKSPPTTGRAAAARKAPTDHAGSVPTITHTSTSSSTGTRIQCGGSWGVRGRSVARGPQNTSTVKRSE